MFPSLRLALAAALVAVAGVKALPQSTDTKNSNSSSSTACNNSPSLCSRQYNAITHAGAHNSAFLRDDSTANTVAGNQFKNATVGLDAGLRFLQAQVHDFNGTLHLCHTSCSLLDAGTLQDWLSLINDWMGKNPNDVVTILLVNSDTVASSVFASAFEGSGLSKYAYTPTTAGATSEWPTLQNMIDQGTRLVSFVTNVDASTSTPYILPEFDYIFETAFEVTTIDGFNSTLDRPSNADSATSAIANNMMGMANHFKYQSLAANIMIPDVSAIDTVNSASTSTTGNLGLHLQTCKTDWGKIPNFFIVDFWNKGNIFEAADKMNDLSDVTGRKTDTQDDTSGGSGNESNLGHGALVAFLGAALLLL